jgi:hypothetical protein
MGASAEQYAQDYRWEKIAGQVAQVYEQVLTKNR